MASVQESPTASIALANQNDNLWKEAYGKLKDEDSDLYERLQSIIEKDSHVKNNLILNHSEEQEAALNGLQQVVEIVQQFTFFNWDYLNLSQDKSERQLKESILNLYWEILRYEATAINNFNRHTIARYAASIVRKDEWKKLLSEVEDYRNSLMSNLQLNESQNQKRFENELLELILQLDRTDEKNLEVIQWVSNKLNISQHYTARQLLSQYPHAGEWIVEKYIKWLHQNGAPAFWLRGTIGTGKTSIMSTVIESFYSDVARQDDQLIIYFYFISPTTSDDVIRSLVSQLAWTSDGNAIEASIVAMFENAKPPNPTIPITDEWSAALLKLCQRVSKVIIAIDALDECVDFSKLLATLRKLQLKQPDGIKFVFSCRLNVDMDKIFTASEGVILTTENTLKDMSEYIENEVRFKEEDIDSNDEEIKRQLMYQIVRVLSDFAGGMWVFKWVTLQLAIMFPIETQTFLPENIEIQLLDIRNRNTSLKQSLNSAYETVYSMNTKPGAYNTSVFKSVFVELMLDYDPKIQRITRSPLSTKVVLHCCSNFVIQSSEGNFRFAHLSVEEYLTNHCAVKVEFQYEEFHLFAMKICLAFMAQERSHSVARLSRKQYLDAILINLTKSRKGEVSTFQIYSISYWAYHAKESIPGRRCREPLYKSFALGAKLSPLFKWWFAQIDAYNYSGSMMSQIMEISDEILGRSDQYPFKSRLIMLGAAFNLPEILENGFNNYKEEVDAPIRTGFTPFLVAIKHGNPDSVKCLLDLGANPTLISVTHRHHIKYGNLGRPIADEDMVYWVTGKGRNSQEQLEGRLQVENALLNHEKSRNHFLNQLESHLRINAHPDPLRALKILYGASNELVQVLDLMDEENFDEEMVAEIVRHDSCATVKKFFKFKHFDSITEQMVRNSLTNLKTFAYLMSQFGYNASIRDIIIDEMPKCPGLWKVILDVKGSQLSNQKFFDSLFEESASTRNLTFNLDSCGTKVTRSSRAEVLDESLLYNVKALNAVLRMRSSLDGSTTEEVVANTLQYDSSDLPLFFRDPEFPSFLTKRIREIAKHGGKGGMISFEELLNPRD
ncbi:hypothetical protein BOTNAR_0123g00180 [Botryotinia narcissicola]|uniref:Uncharacterized protein n=1 Tax=Botryotinia narcissicola TaxID=278944 RepID=A0A4Z1IY91_9HELO|nr:hypothetical protein BOTNAR_0123g00180 [Botryotinia narcissicola]